MDRKKLQTLIERSMFLSAEECAYWLSNLPKLDDAACAQLEKILTVPEDKTFQKTLGNYFAALDSAFKKISPAGKTA